MKSKGVEETQQEARDTVLQMQPCLCQRSPSVPCALPHDATVTHPGLLLATPARPTPAFPMDLAPAGICPSVCGAPRVPLGCLWPAALNASSCSPRAPSQAGLGPCPPAPTTASASLAPEASLLGSGTCVPLASSQESTPPRDPSHSAPGSFWGPNPENFPHLRRRAWSTGTTSSGPTRSLWSHLPGPGCHPH